MTTTATIRDAHFPVGVVALVVLVLFAVALLFALGLGMGIAPHPVRAVDAGISG